MDEIALRKLLAQRFIQRTDVKAVQDSKGYHPEKTKWTAQDVLDHLHSKRSLGHYLLDTDNNCKLFAFDIDITKEWLERWRTDGDYHDLINMQLNAFGEALARRAQKMTGCDVASAFSGNKGIHVYCFTGTEPAEDVRAVALETIESFDAFEPVRGNNFFRQKYGDYIALEIEVFPKQTEISEDGFGNLMRLPLGKNRKSGKPGYFIKFIPPTNELTQMDPMAALSGEVPWAT